MSYRIRNLIRVGLNLSLVLPLLAGCAAFKPMNGVPARYLPDEMKVGDRSGKKTIDLSLLSQRWNGVHLVDSGDVLGIYVAGLLGKIEENPPVQIPQNVEFRPAAGFPVTVREDGTISLPLLGALSVRGMTTRQVEEAIRRTGTDSENASEFLKPGAERILVSLLRPRQTQVMVVRQDSAGEPLSNSAVGMLNIGTVKRGTGKVVSLPAYKNDVLNALVATNGLPGLDAENAVYIIRRQIGTSNGLPDPAMSDPAALIRQMKSDQRATFRGQNRDLWSERENLSGRFDGSSGFNSAASSSTSLHNDSISEASFPGLQWGTAAAPSQFDSRSQSLHEEDTDVPNGQMGFQDRSRYNGNSNLIPAQWNQGQLPSAAPPQQQYPYSNSTAARNPTPIPPLPPQQSYSTSPGYSNEQPSSPAEPPLNSMPVRPRQTYPVPEIPSLSNSVQGNPDFYGESNDYDSGSRGNTIGVGIADGRRIIRIPIRLGPDEQVDIKPEDVILYDGDIVFIESRDTEVFFTGGLLGGGQYTLPRDYDLDILQALSIATSRAGVTGGAARQLGGVTALNSDVTISPSNVVVIRKLPDGNEIPIKIDIYRARNDLSERLIVQPGDYIYLQYTPLEAVGAFIDRHLLEGALFGVFSQQAFRNN